MRWRNIKLLNIFKPFGVGKYFMPSFTRNFITILFVYSSFFISNTPAVALADSLTEQLSNIEKIQNKEHALKQVVSLLNAKFRPAKEEITLLQTQANLYHQLGELSNAILVTKKVQQLASAALLVAEEAKAYKMIGVYNYFKGENTKALEAYQKSLTLYQTMPDKLLQANLLNNIGLVYAALGNTVSALNNYQLAQEIYLNHGSEQDKVDIRFNIAGLYLRLKRADIAIEMFHQVIETRLLLDDQAGLAMVYGDLGSAYKYSGQLDKAKSYLQRSLAYFLTHEQHYHAASQLHNLAELHNQLKEFDTAVDYAKQAIALSLAQGHKNAYSGSLYALAKALFYLGDFQGALEKLEVSDQQARNIGYQQQINANLALFSLIYAANGQVEEALDAHEQFVFENDKRASDALNVQLARFESEKLKQQVAQLQQTKKLQQLEMEQSTQQRNLIIIATLLVSFVVFYLLRRKTEKELQLTLANQVKLRTEQLEASTLALKKANKVKSEFLANMSHEIRTPLTAVIGQAEAIIYGEVDDCVVQEEVGVIHSNSLHLLELINDILDLSKIEAEKLELEIQHQDLQPILIQLVDLFSDQAQNKGLSFVINHQLPQPFKLAIDGLRLKQILINLCSNAIKFTETGSVKMDILIENEHLIFNVSDTGIGLSYTQLQQIFDSFTQGDSSISRRFGGSGLGLCLSDQLAKLMQGRIELESTLGKGSTFSLILPFKDKLAQGGVKSASTDVLADTPREQNRHFSGSVLLADDHEDNLGLITRFLESLGLTVFKAHNGKEAITLFEQHLPDFVLLDIQMPEMDGLEAFNILRQKGCTQPVYALTANAMSHEVEGYLAKGFDGHLKKPIERVQFISALNKVFSNDEKNIEQAQESLAQVDMSDLVIKFKSNLVLEQQDIILHIKNNELENLATISHRIAGAAQMFGFAPLSDKAIKLELAIKSGNAEALTELSQALLDEIEQVLW